jgi:hypothetical protein
MIFISGQLQIEPQELKLSTFWARFACVCKLKPALLDAINSAAKVDTVWQKSDKP